MSFRKQPIPEDAAHKIWDILLEHTKLEPPEEGTLYHKYDVERNSFVTNAVDGNWTEWRFGGGLGFGGKVWNNAGRWYVTCYSEDETPEREEIIAKTNEALAKLRAKTYGEG